MQKLNLSQLWHETYNFGVHVRKNNKDGFVEWGPLKTKYSKYYIANNDDGIPLLDSFKEFEEKLVYNLEINDLDHLNVVMEINSKIMNNKDHHFFIQHFRIPKMFNYKLTVVKLLQIAYNAGQLKADMDDNRYDGDIISFYTQNSLYDIKTYVAENFIEEVIIVKSE
jgi:hypothetical protein